MFFFLWRLKSVENAPSAQQDAVTGDGAWPFNTDALSLSLPSSASSTPSKWARARTGKCSAFTWSEKLTVAVRPRTMVVLMCRGGKSLTHSLWPIWCVIIVLSLLSSCGTLGEKKHLNLMERQEVEKQRAMWVQEGTRQFRKLHSENKPLFTLLFLWAIPASGHRLPSWREPAEKKGNKIGELQSILSFFWCVYARLGDYFSVWEPMGAAARGTDLMSLPECFRAWQKKKERERERETIRACSVSNSLQHSGYWRSTHVCWGCIYTPSCMYIQYDPLTSSNALFVYSTYWNLSGHVTAPKISHWLTDNYQQQGLWGKE